MINLAGILAQACRHTAGILPGSGRPSRRGPPRAARARDGGAPGVRGRAHRCPAPWIEVPLGLWAPHRLCPRASGSQGCRQAPLWAPRCRSLYAPGIFRYAACGTGSRARVHAPRTGTCHRLQGGTGRAHRGAGEGRPAAEPTTAGNRIRNPRGREVLHRVGVSLIRGSHLTLECLAFASATRPAFPCAPIIEHVRAGAALYKNMR